MKQGNDRELRKRKIFDAADGRIQRERESRGCGCAKRRRELGKLLRKISTSIPSLFARQKIQETFSPLTVRFQTADPPSRIQVDD